MRGPGGWVRSKRLMAIGGLPGIEERSSVPPQRAEGKGSAGVGRRLGVVDDAFAEGVDAVGDERLLADRAERMHAAGREGNRDTGFEADDPVLTVEPGLAAA